MNKSLINTKSIVTVILLIVYILIFKIGYYDMIFDHYSRGFRYPVLLAEVFLFPLYFLGSIIHIASKIYKQGIIDWSIARMIGKYLAFFIFLFFLFFIMGMILN